jgi:hypothetical protein
MEKNCHEFITIAVRAILGSDKKVRDVKVVEETLKQIPEKLGKELGEKCKKATSQIKFEPATKDGRPVSQYVKVEYTFCFDHDEEKELPPETAKPN